MSRQDVAVLLGRTGRLGGAKLPENLALPALGAQAASSGSGANHDASLTIDSNDATYWLPSTTTIVGKWLGCDLGEVVTVSGFRLRQHITAPYAATQVRVDTSPDGVTWTQGETKNISLGDNTVSITPISARWFRLVATASTGSWWTVYTQEWSGEPFVQYEVPTTLEGANITQVLDWLDDNYHASTAAWIATHAPLPEAVDAALLSGIAYLISQSAGGAGFEVDLSPILAALGSSAQYTVFDKMDAQGEIRNTEYLAVLAEIGEAATGTNGAVVGVYNDLIDAEGALFTHLDVGEGNIEAAITAAHAVTDGLIAGIGGIDQAALDAAQSAVETAIVNAQNALTGSIEAGDAGVIGDVNGHTDLALADLPGPINDHTDLVQTALEGAINGAVNGLTDRVAEGTAEVILALGNLDPPASGPPVWPGLANVTLGDPVALSDQLVLVGPMDGVLINVSTPPSKVGVYRIGERYYDYKVGELTFETDNGETESFQYLGFRQAIYTPRTMQRAAKCRFRVLAGAEGSATLWTKT